MTNTSIHNTMTTVIATSVVMLAVICVITLCVTLLVYLPFDYAIAIILLPTLVLVNFEIVMLAER